MHGRRLLVCLAVSVLAIQLLLVSGTAFTAYALGCSPARAEFKAEGPYASSLEGFASISNRTTGDQMISVLTVEPGSVASFKVAYSLTFPSQWDFSIQPIILRENTTIGGGLKPLLPPPTWLNASSEPSAIVVPPKGQVNVTVTLHVSEDAPAGEYELMLAGWTGDQYDLKYCPYAPLSFILKVTPERPVTTTTTQIVSTTTTSTITKTSTETLTEISAITSIERVTEPSTYAWAVGVTAIAAVLATILVVKRKSNW